MRLTRLELHGFKSFADRTDIVFDNGVTAVVGPNGCGKSNVSDAVRWVLGEQRARALRGAKMEEVIFQGSSARRAVNIAEVSLHFDNEDGTLPTPFKEVVITRRLSRSGDSEYMLNRAPCRLRDIHDLVRGTGLGADSGVVIESKMIDALLSDRPDDRRELFEEAAGVGLYRDRRRSTERRLEETTVDLQRLDDLIAEVQSQVRSLARQRKRAERHSELNARRFNLELTHASREMAAWREEHGQLQTRVAELRERAPEAEDRIRAAEGSRDAAHAERTAAEAQRAELARLVATQRLAVQQLQGEIAVAEERQRNGLERRSRAEEERREKEELEVRLAEERALAESELARLTAELQTIAQSLDERQKAEEEARAALSVARATVDQAERTMRDLRDAMRRHELDREGAAREQEELTRRNTLLAEERGQLADRVAGIRREMTEADESLEIARAAFATAAAALDAAKTSAREAREREGVTRAELQRADETLTALQGKTNALEALERERVGLAPAAARLLKDRDQFGDGAIIGPLSDFIGADSQAALLVERFLGATVHAILIRGQDVAEKIRTWHMEHSPGPLLLLPLDAMIGEDESSLDSHALAFEVKVNEPARSWVRNLLGHVHAVENGAAFIDARGAVWLPGSATGPGPLRRRAELLALRAELETAEEARARAAAAAEHAKAALEAADRAADAAAEASAAAQQEARHAETHRADAERRLQRAEKELGEADALAAKLQERGEALAARVEQLEASMAERTTALVTHEAVVTSHRSALATAEHAQEVAREARTAMQVERAQGQARHQMAVDRARRLNDEASSATQRLETLRSELTSLAEADSALAERMSAWRTDLAAQQEILHDGERRLADAELAVATADQNLNDAEHALDEVRRATAAYAEELHHAELRFTELSGKQSGIRARLETEWRRPLEELLATYVEEQTDDESLATELSALREQLEQLGQVNPLAIEEHDEEVKRLEFLTTQRADLAEARQSLQQAIREIDVTARELFLTTFTQVREHFRQIFMTLFGGGECDLRLENPDMPLDCDIEIHASPRGKRTQRIHLLSSGERALVALSLLFGIFLTKPSPFCLLDEVDAPLDDQNIGRFVRMLNQFKTRTQFIVITHNPRTTTEAADSVYGVTMQEPGVSSVVSVRLRGEAIEDAIAGRGNEPAAAAPVGAGA